MKVRNPWIDPRVAEVRVAAVETYLKRHGWAVLPEVDSTFREFESPVREQEGVILRVPQLEHGRDYVQRMIELITDLALFEGRLAVLVLNDILAVPHSKGVNGVPVVPVMPAPSST